MTEITDGRHIDVLKPEYFHLDSSGLLTQLTAAGGCNGYSEENARLVKAHAAQQFVTVSGDISGMVALASNKSRMASFTTTLMTFLKQVQFTGVELDIEGFAAWTAVQYAEYKMVVTQVGTALHTAGFQLMIDVPAIPDTTYQGYYRLKYEDFELLPVDYMTVMCYDFMYDTGAGTPVAPISSIIACCQWIQSKITDHTRLVIGINSYGYHGAVGGYTITEDTYEESCAYAGFSTAVRDTGSSEMMWTKNGVAYIYSDPTTLATKIQAIESSGLSAVSIWHVGGKNPWPIQIAMPVSPSVSAPTDHLLAAFDTKYPGFSTWYQTHFDGKGNYLG